MTITLHAVSFDMDGTLYSLRAMVFRNLPAMMGLAGFFKVLHRIRDEMRGSGPFEDFRAEQAKRFANATGVDAARAAEMISCIIDDRWPAMFRRVRPYRRVREVLHRLRSKGIGLAIVSDYPIEKKLRLLGIEAEMFEACIVTEQVGALKPHPRPFMMAAERLGVDPCNMLHVGDREDCDVAGARNAGMLAALFKPGPGRRKTDADIVFGSWRKFLPMLERKGLL